jgi:thymidylate synthase
MNNTLDKQYTDLLQDILDNGVTKQDRTGTGTLSVFGRQIRHKMSDGFPLLTTKKMAFKSIVTELLWFLRGDTNIKYLVDNGCHIWDGDTYKNYTQTKVIKTENGETHISPPGHYNGITQEEFINRIKTDDEFAKKWGELGPIYGRMWRAFDEDAYGGIDQIAKLINDLKTNPDSRRMIVTAWHPLYNQHSVLPPCHYGFQMYTRELSESELWDYILKNKIKILHQHAVLYGHEVGSKYRKSFIPTLKENYNIPTRAISLMWNQRSVDTGLGLSFNIASYSLLLMMIAKQVNMIPDELIGNLGDVHLYLNHIDPIKEQLTREPYELPTVKISDRVVNDISEYTLDDIILENYQSHPVIRMPISN